MSTAAIANHKSGNRQWRGDKGRVTRKTLAAMFAEWKKVSPNVAIESIGDCPIEEFENPEREVRLWWCNQQIENRKSPITSWNSLAEGEGRFLLKKMREESGDGPAYRARLIARLAQELFGAPWDRLLQDRLRARFRKFKAEDLTPAEAHAEIEELLSRVARAKGEEIETVRARVRGSKL